MYSSIYYEAIGLLPGVAPDMPQSRHTANQKSAFRRFLAWVSGPGQLVLAISGMIITLIVGFMTLASSQTSTRYEIILARNEFSAARTEMTDFRKEMKTVIDGEEARKKADAERHKAIIEALRYLTLRLKDADRRQQIERIILELENKKISEIEHWRDADNGGYDAGNALTPP